MSLKPKYTVAAKLESAGNGSLEVGAVRQSLSAELAPFIQGQAREPYIHTQVAPLSIWTIAHNLGYRADVTVYDANDEQVICDVRHDNENQTTLIFSQPFSGTARAS